MIKQKAFVLFSVEESFPSRWNSEEIDFFTKKLLCVTDRINQIDVQKTTPFAKSQEFKQAVSLEVEKILKQKGIIK